MPRRAVPASPSGECLGQVLQADLGARPHDANRSHDPTAWRVLLCSEHMLDARAYPALGVVHSHLRYRQRMIAPTASMNPTVVTTGPELGLDLGRSISENTSLQVLPLSTLSNSPSSSWLSCTAASVTA